MYNDWMDLEASIPGADQALAAAFDAYQRGDQRAARRLAEQAAALAPEREEAWLLMAVLASPKAAHYYLSRAEQARPGSERVEAGKRWHARQPAGYFDSNRAGLPAWVVFPERFKAPKPQRKVSKGVFWVVGLLALALVGAAVVGIPRWMAQSAAPEDSRVVRAVQTALKNAQLAQISETPSPTPTLEPSSTPTPLPTFTATLEPTATSTGTATPKPSATKKPTQVPPTKTATPISYTVKRGDTLNLIAQRFKVTVVDMITFNKLTNPSLLYPGQVLLIPSAAHLASAAALPTAVAIPSAGGKGKEIQIDISEQHLYAYENGKLVFSYVVSTGIYNSTRIGTFKVLDKIPNAYSSRFNIWMPYWMGIYYSGTLENGIHGLPLLWNGVELWGNLLGQPATYGCIEARTWEIKKLYEWAEIGTPVIIRR